MTRYDTIVIGAGTAGEKVFWSLNAAGQNVAVIERELVGGTCAYWGCIPSKTLLRPGGIQWEARHGFGVSRPDLAWPAVSSYRDYMVRDYNDREQVEEIRQAGMDFYRGDAQVQARGKVSVNGEQLEADQIVLATGSEAVVPPIPGLKEAGYWTNREATAMKEVPESVIIIGGGAIGCEMGQVFHSFGAEVAIVEEAPQLLGRESPDAARYLQEAFERESIYLHLGRKAQKVECDHNGRHVTLDNGRTLTADVILVATGRLPRLEGLNHENLGITASRRGIEVDEYCRAAKGFWAVGDVTGGGFTHVADYQGGIVVDDILGHPHPANYDAVPRVTYTDPEMAAVGIARREDAPSGADVIEAHADLNAASRTATYGTDLHGALHLLADRKRRVLLGAWAAGPIAGEWIQWATLAIRAQVPIETLHDTILAFPTFTRLYLEPIQQLNKQLTRE